VKIAYFNKRKREKRVKRIILDQKLILNHPSLVDELDEISQERESLVYPI